MDDVITFNDFSGHDRTAMAIYVYQARQQIQNETIDIAIHGFKFQCSTQSGDVTQLLQREGSITSRLGSKEAEAYLYQVKAVMMLAAKMHVLSELKKLPDAALASLITINFNDTATLDERNIHADLKRLAQSSGSTLLTAVGLFKAPSPRSEVQHIVHQELNKFGVSNITNFSAADTLCATIRSRLSLDRPLPKPEPR